MSYIICFVTTMARYHWYSCNKSHGFLLLLLLKLKKCSNKRFFCENLKLQFLHFLLILRKGNNAEIEYLKMKKISSSSKKQEENTKIMKS